MKPSRRFVKEVDEIVHMDRYDTARFKSEEQIRRHIKEKLRPAFKKVI